MLVLFGAYGAYLCGQTSVEIVQSLWKTAEADEDPAADSDGDPVAAVQGEVSAG